MHTCNWYISSSVGDVLAQVIKHMGNALRTHMKDLDLTIIDAKHISGIERVKNIFARKEIWHLFGQAPAWWRIVRIHSRTVHTLLDGGTHWGGYPSRFFTEGAKNGEAVISPVFDPISSNTEDGITGVFVNGHNENIPEGDYDIVDISDRILRPEALSGIYIAQDTTPREAMRAGLLTMRGVSVASRKSGYLDEILGPDGYFMLDDNSDLSKVIRLGLSERGRRMAMSARHFLKSRRSHEKCTDSIRMLYRKVLAQ